MCLYILAAFVSVEVLERQAELRLGQIVAMAFNLTGSNIDLYFTVNTAINVGITCLMILPTVVLSLLSIVAMLFAKEINWPIRVLIINILAAEIVFWVGYAFLIIGFIPRLHIAGEGNVSCRVALSLVVVSFTLKLSAIALYAINVYIFIRYGLKKVSGRSLFSIS